MSSAAQELVSIVDGLPEDKAREDLQELTQWILKSCRVA